MAEFRGYSECRCGRTSPGPWTGGGGDGRKKNGGGGGGGRTSYGPAVASAPETAAPTTATHAPRGSYYALVLYIIIICKYTAIVRTQHPYAAAGAHIIRIIATQAHRNTKILYTRRL